MLKYKPSNGSMISRRTVLKGAAAGAAILTLPNIITAAENPFKTQGPEGHRYESNENWAQVPKHISLGYTHGVCVDSNGRVIVHHTGKDSVILFDDKGKFIKSWGNEFEGGAHGLTVSKEGGDEFLYLTDTARDVMVKTTLDGKEIYTIGLPKEAGVYNDDVQYTPTNVAIAPNGDVYIADGYGSSFIHQFNKNAEYIRTWGGKGSEDGKMNCPHGITIDTRGDKPLVLVADRANVRLQYFTLDGKHVKNVTNELRHPCHFDEYKGELLVPDLFGRVTLFDKNDKLIAHLGGDSDWNKPDKYPNVPKDTLVTGKFVSPHSACYDADGNIFVAEWINYGRVTKMARV
ncbi:MAG: twin-arginine translocation signal domain-containing protein [Candidatus Hinthialibacter antarcticus]|nr:twin-arginine translocation signal domain-containing protein [Candidatus Hinthialibacter antarcticus]